MQLLRRSVTTVVLSSLTAATLVSVLPAYAEDFPIRSLTLVVPFTAGGITDATARLVARKLGDHFKQPVVVDNRPGAGGNVGAAVVAKARPDGYTLLLGTQGTHAANQYLYQAMAFDPLRDFTAVHGVMAVPNVIVVRADKPWKSLAELVASARSKPRGLTYASPGNGTGAHLSAELFQSVTGVQLTHVPYRGSAPAVTDLLGGSVDLAFDYASSTAAHIQAGKLRALAVTGPSRLQALADIPTVRELGHPAAQATSWTGIFVASATPKPTVEALRRGLEQVMRDPEVVSNLNVLGAQPMPMDQPQFGAFVRDEQHRWKTVVQASGARMD